MYDMGFRWCRLWDGFSFFFLRHCGNRIPGTRKTTIVYMYFGRRSKDRRTSVDISFTMRPDYLHNTAFPSTKALGTASFCAYGIDTHRSGYQACGRANFKRSPEMSGISMATKPILTTPALTQGSAAPRKTTVSMVSPSLIQISLTD